MKSLDQEIIKRFLYQQKKKKTQRKQDEQNHRKNHANAENASKDTEFHLQIIKNNRDLY